MGSHNRLVSGPCHGIVDWVFAFARAASTDMLLTASLTIALCVPRSNQQPG
jgi:hypothetical protein